MMWRSLCFLAQSALIIVLFCGSLSRAQTSQIPERVVGPVDELSLTTLHGNVSAAIQPQYDRGETPGATRLTHMRIVLARSAEQQAALDRFEQELQEKSSPNHHKWLTPDQFGKLYGPADSDIAAIVAWLQSHGLTLESVSPGRTNIAFSGMVSQAEEALHTSIHSYERDGEQFYANNTDPEIPLALAPVIRGIAHLNTLRPRHLSVRASSGRRNPDTGRLEPFPTTANSRVAPNYMGSTGDLYVVPGDAATIYDTPNSILNANYQSGPNYDGTGVTIGIGGGDVIQPTTVQNYRSHFLGNTTAPTITNVDGDTNSAAPSEAYLDIEIAGGLAPGATIHYYVANDLNAAIERALTDNTVDIFSFSYLLCEKLNTTAGNALINSYWEQAAAQGIAVTVASGDSGSAGCDDETNSNGQDTPDATTGLAVNGYASTPYNVAVGGTDFYTFNQSSSSYSTSGGSAKTYYRSALKYIPESTWNDSTQFDNALIYNQPWGIGSSIYPANIIAGGGGASSCATNQTAGGVESCVSGYSKPSWQRGTGVPADGARDLPDVALLAGNGQDGATWLVCDDSINVTSGLPDDCSAQPDGSFNFAAYGGTSTSAPAFAGILALVEQSTGGRLGQAAAQLFNLYNGNHASAIFHDVTQGNNSVACTQGSPNCNKNMAGYYFETGYNATAGYDLATGLGSVDASQLINYWNTAYSGATANVTVTATPGSITAAQSFSVTVTVAGSGNLATPTGTATLTGGGYTSSAETLSNGTYTFTIPANILSVGTDTLTATYSGDTNYASATGTATVAVTAVPTPPAFTLSATRPSPFAPGASATSTVTVSGSNGYTGTVALSCVLTSSPAGATNLPTCSAAGSSVSLSSTVTTGSTGVSINTTPPTAGILQATPFGNPRWFRAAGGSAVLALLIFFVPGRTRKWNNMLGACVLVAAIGFAAIGCGSASQSSGGNGGGGTLAKTTPTVTVTPATSSIVVNTPTSVALTVTGSGMTTPTGTIALTSGNYASSATTLAGGAANITIPASSLILGQNTLTAAYSGDTNYNAAAGTAMLTATSLPPVGGTTPGTYIFTVTGTGNDSAKTTATTTFTITVS